MREPYRPRATYRYWCTITTRWHDNDLYGHVNNVVYYSWLDTAVNGWLIEHGLLELDGDQPIGLVIETRCRYASPLAFPVDVEIGLSAAAIGNSSVTYHLGVFEAGAAAASAEAHFTHVYVDRCSRKPIAISDRLRRSLETIVVTAPSGFL